MSERIYLLTYLKSKLNAELAKKTQTRWVSKQFIVLSQRLKTSQTNISTSLRRSCLTRRSFWSLLLPSREMAARLNLGFIAHDCANC